MLYLIIGLISIAALLGIFLLSYVLQGKNTPKGVAFTHGQIAVVGVVLLIIYAFFFSPAPFYPIVFFLLAACLGVILIHRDLTGKSVPLWLALVHGLFAIIGFVFLLNTALSPLFH